MRRLVELGKHKSGIQPAGSRGAETKEQSKQESERGQREEPMFKLLLLVPGIALELPDIPRVSDGRRRAWGYVGRGLGGPV